MLSSKYLSKFPEMDDKVLFSVIDNAPGDSYDLLVSNYALSELSLEIQREYIEKVLKRCKRFYLVFNQIGDLNLDDLIQSLPEYDIHVEIEHPSLPYKDKLNRILYGTKRNIQ